MRKPIIVVIDGANGVGKSTIIKKMKQKILENNLTVDVLRQPFYNVNRDILLSGELNYLDAYNIFYKDRVKLLSEKVINSNCDIVLLDRSFIASIFHQGIEHDDLCNLKKIINDSLRIYKRLGIKINIGVNLYSDPNIISQRHSKKDDNEFDFRDTLDIKKIKSELYGYKLAWNIGIMIGLVNNFRQYENNINKDIDKIVNHLLKDILELLKKE
jgi:thymidylate kinase